MKVVRFPTSYHPATAEVWVLDRVGIPPEDQIVRKTQDIVLTAPTGQAYLVTMIDRFNDTIHLVPTNLENHTPPTCA